MMWLSSAIICSPAAVTCSFRHFLCLRKKEFDVTLSHEESYDSLWSNYPAPLLTVSPLFALFLLSKVFGFLMSG